MRNAEAQVARHGMSDATNPPRIAAQESSKAATAARNPHHAMGCKSLSPQRCSSSSGTAWGQREIPACGAATARTSDILPATDSGGTPPALWATGGLTMSFFPLPKSPLPLRGGVYPSPYPLPWTWTGPVASRQRVLFSLIGRAIFDTPHEDRGPRGGADILYTPSFDRPPPRWPQEALQGSQEASKRAPRGRYEAPRGPQDAPRGLQEASQEGPKRLKSLIFR